MLQEKFIKMIIGISVCALLLIFSFGSNGTQVVQTTEVIKLNLTEDKNLTFSVPTPSFTRGASFGFVLAMCCPDCNVTAHQLSIPEIKVQRHSYVQRNATRVDASCFRYQKHRCRMIPSDLQCRYYPAKGHQILTMEIRANEKYKDSEMFLYREPYSYGRETAFVATMSIFVGLLLIVLSWRSVCLLLDSCNCRPRCKCLEKNKENRMQQRCRCFFASWHQCCCRKKELNVAHVEYYTERRWKEFLTDNPKKFSYFYVRHDRKDCKICQQSKTSISEENIGERITKRLTSQQDGQVELVPVQPADKEPEEKHDGPFEQLDRSPPAEQCLEAIEFCAQIISTRSDLKAFSISLEEYSSIQEQSFLQQNADPWVPQLQRWRGGEPYDGTTQYNNLWDGHVKFDLITDMQPKYKKFPSKTVSFLCLEKSWICSLLEVLSLMLHFLDVGSDIEYLVRQEIYSAWHFWGMLITIVLPVVFIFITRKCYKSLKKLYAGTMYQLTISHWYGSFYQAEEAYLALRTKLTFVMLENLPQLAFQLSNNWLLGLPVAWGTYFAPAVSLFSIVNTVKDWNALDLDGGFIQRAKLATIMYQISVCLTILIIGTWLVLSLAPLEEFTEDCMVPHKDQLHGCLQSYMNCLSYGYVNWGNLCKGNCSISEDCPGWNTCPWTSA